MQRSVVVVGKSNKSRPIQVTTPSTVARGNSVKGYLKRWRSSFRAIMKSKYFDCRNSL